MPGASIPEALNHGIDHALQTAPAPRHVLLLAEPCTVPGGLPALLAAALSAAPETGIAAPICRPPSAESAAREALLFRRCNAGQTAPLRVAGGPCLGISHACLRQTGRLRDDAYACGTAALIDFALRARHLGWRAVMACDAFLPVPARATVPAVQAALEARDSEVLERLHPGIGGLMQAEQQADPGAAARRRVGMAAWARGRRRGGATILVTHGQGGGVERRVRQRAAAIAAQGGRAIVIRPAEDGAGGRHWCVSDGPDATHPDLVFAAPGEFAALTAFLAGDAPALVELHHAASHPQEICGLADALGIPYELVVHDFAMICPRVTCLGGQGRYCGEPADVTECDDCIADHGARIGEIEPVASLRARSAALAAGARRVLAPSADAAARFRRYAPGVAGIVTPAPGEGWEDDASLAAGVPRHPVRRHDSSVTVCLVGAIGTDKGFDVLLACARDASRRRLNLRFRVVGHTIDDDRLIATGRVFVTGRYEEHEAVALIRAQHADIGFLPSVWPETWCYALSALWQSGLWTLAFALGAQAERIAATGAGRVVPLGVPAGRLNDMFCAIPGKAGAHG
jgi:glycosyltransferase involved in cell wall biosynthesis